MKIQNKIYICPILRTDASGHLAAPQDSKTIWLADMEAIIAVCHFHLLSYQRDLEQLSTGKHKKGGKGHLVHSDPCLSPKTLIFKVL
jgi:hypothetical protein